VTPDYYVRLNVVPEAEDDVIRAAYLALAKRYHPDATSDSPHDSEKFQLITEAYGVLGDRGRRAQYDKDHGRQMRLAAQREKFAQVLRAREAAEGRARARNGWRSTFIPLVFSVGGFAVAALAFGQIKVPGFDRLSANSELAMQQPKDQEQSELLSALYKAQGEAQAYQELLAQERDRSQALEDQLAARQDAPQDEAPAGQETASLPSQTVEPTPGTTDDKPAETSIAETQPVAAVDPSDAAPTRGDVVTSPSPVPELAQAMAMDTPPADSLPPSDKPMLPANGWATMEASTIVSEQPGNPESIRLIARAGLLLEQRNIGVARTVLERAVDLGSARALFLLAETYDPAILSAWGTFGTRGDVAKAQELYFKAFAGGIREARERLNVSR
jgi:curved DNA-binding protein CbpA